MQAGDHRPVAALRPSEGTVEASEAPVRPTSKDVARLARVSQPTVSRALRDGPSPVAAATRRRVQRAARQLGYVRNESGRSLATRRTHQIGVVVDDLGNPFYLELIDTLHREAEAAGFRLVVLTSQDDQRDRATRLLDGSLDGVVLTTVEVQSSLPSTLAAHGFPFVLLNRESRSGPAADTCVVDNDEGARAVAVELARLGHRRIAAIFGPPTTSTAEERERGFRRGLAEASISLSTAMTRRGGYAFGAGHRAMRELLAARPRPTAVFCANDVIALGALNAAAGLGVAVPEELTIIGFDDIAMSGWELFELTTVRQDLGAMTHIATQLLVSRIADRERPPQRVVLPAELVLRRTHAPPRENRRAQSSNISGASPAAGSR